MPCRRGIVGIGVAGVSPLPPLHEWQEPYHHEGRPAATVGATEESSKRPYTAQRDDAGLARTAPRNGPGQLLP